MPRDPQGAGTRTETRVEWRNVYEDKDNPEYPEWRVCGFASRDDADAHPTFRRGAKTLRRIAVERIETRTTITRYPIPPHAGEETKG